MSKRIPVRLDPERLSASANRVAGLISGGGKLMVEFITDERAVTGRRITALPAGRRVQEADFSELSAKGRIVPMRDGLFSGFSQTWVIP